MLRWGRVNVAAASAVALACGVWAVAAHSVPLGAAALVAASLAVVAANRRPASRVADPAPLPTTSPSTPPPTLHLRAPRGVEPTEVLAALVRNSSTAGAPISAHMWLDDPSTKTMRLVAASGVEPDPQPLDSASGVVGAALASRGTQLAADTLRGEDGVDHDVRRFVVPLVAGESRGVAIVDLDARTLVDQDVLTRVAASMRGALTGALALHVAQGEVAAAKVLLETSRDLSRLIDPDAVIDTALTRAMQLSGAQTGSVMLVDRDSGCMGIAASRGLPRHVVDGTAVREGEGIAGWVLASGQPLVVEDLNGRGPRSRRHGVRSAVSVPIADDDGVLGVLNVGSRQFHARFSTSHMEALESLGRSTAIALRNARAMRTSQDLYFDTLKALAVALETKDPYAFAATERVVDYVVALGAAMGLDDAEMHALKIAGMLHDVGMSAAGDAVTVSSRPLSTVEWGMLKMHPVIAAEILAQAPALKDAIPIVYHHHEHFDGSGYVVGLSEQQIPIGARILAVADAYVAMTSERPYRRALTPAAALDELRSLAGSQFDPDVVEAFSAIALAENPARS